MPTSSRFAFAFSPIAAVLRDVSPVTTINLAARSGSVAIRAPLPPCRCDRAADRDEMPTHHGRRSAHSRQELMVGAMLRILLALPFLGRAGAATSSDFSPAASASNLADPSTQRESRSWARGSTPRSHLRRLGGVLVARHFVYDSYPVCRLTRSCPILEFQLIPRSRDAHRLFVIGVLISPAR